MPPRRPPEPRDEPELPDEIVSAEPPSGPEEYGPDVKRAEFGVAADTAELRRLRHGVVEFARDTGGDDDVVESLELAVSELATNVIQYTDAEQIHVVVQCTPSTWILDVADADELELPIDFEMPRLSAAEGRGLFVTQAVMDTLTAVDIDGRRVVRCTKAAR
jgi:anti-sigma regulatory factor (Ser/Thr protein kinase)